MIGEFIKPAIESWQRGDLAATEAQLKRAALSDDGGLNALAELLLADLFRSRGAVEDAFIALGIAAGSPQGTIAALASCVMGNMYEEYGDIQAAQSSYEKAMASGNADLAARARAYLAQLKYYEGDVDTAVALLSDVAARGVREWSGRAAGLLGDIRFANGDYAEAYEAFRRAAELDAPTEADRAVVILSVLVDAGFGGESAAEEYASLNVPGVSAERQAYIESTLDRWSRGGPISDSLAVADPLWSGYYRSAQKYLASH